MILPVDRTLALPILGLPCLRVAAGAARPEMWESDELSLR
jgi:hypothetical protein